MHRQGSAGGVRRRRCRRATALRSSARRPARTTPRTSPRRSRRPAARASQRSSRNFRRPGGRDSTTWVMSSAVRLPSSKRNSSDNLRVGWSGGYPVTTKPDEPALRSSGNARSTSARARPKSTGSRFCQPSPSRSRATLLDCSRRMRDPAPTENPLSVGHEPVDFELEFSLFGLAHGCIGRSVGAASCAKRAASGGVGERGLRPRVRKAAILAERRCRGQGRIAAFMAQDLEFTGERFIPGAAGEIWYEHWHRYHFAAPMVAGLAYSTSRAVTATAARCWPRAQPVTGVDMAHAAVAHARCRYAERHESRLPAGGLRGAAARRRKCRRGRVVRNDRTHRRPGGVRRRNRVACCGPTAC